MWTELSMKTERLQKSSTHNEICLQLFETIPVVKVLNKERKWIARPKRAFIKCHRGKQWSCNKFWSLQKQDKWRAIWQALKLFWCLRKITPYYISRNPWILRDIGSLFHAIWFLKYMEFNRKDQTWYTINQQAFSSTEFLNYRYMSIAEPKVREITNYHKPTPWILITIRKCLKVCKFTGTCKYWKSIFLN